MDKQWEKQRIEWKKEESREVLYWKIVMGVLIIAVTINIICNLALYLIGS